MARIEVGRWTIGLGWLRTAVVAAAGVGLAGGLALGVALAQAAEPSREGGAPGAQQTALPGAEDGSPKTGLGSAAVRPLHLTLLELVSRDARAVLFGKLTQLDSESATLVTRAGVDYAVRVPANLKVLRRRPRPGDEVLIFGQPALDGVFDARAVFIRPAAGFNGRAPVGQVRRFA